MKLDANGNFLWARNMSGSSNEGGFGIALDDLSNIYTVGRFEGTVDFDPGAGIYNLTSKGSFDVFVSKLNAAGNFVWAKQIGGTGHDYGNSIAVDQNRNVLIAGSFTQVADFDPGPAEVIFKAAGTDPYIEKLDQNGNLVWVKQLVGDLAAYVWGITVDLTGNVFCTGSFWGTVDFNPEKSITSNLKSVNDSYDIFILKLTSSGSYVWVRQIGSAYPEQGNSICLDAAANVYTTGYYQGTVNFNTSGGVSNLTSVNTDLNIYVQKIDSSGNFIWAVSLGGERSNVGTSVTVESSGNVLCTGSFSTTGNFNPSGNFMLTSVGGEDIFIQKLTQKVTSTTNIDLIVGSVALIPNLVSDEAVLKVIAKHQGLISWSLFSVNGQKLNSFEQKVIIGENNRRLHFRRLSSGVYFLRGRHTNGEVFTVRFVKQG